MAEPIYTPESYLTIAQAAELLACSPDTVRRLVNRGQLRAYRFGRLIRISIGDLSRAGQRVRTATKKSATPAVPVREIADAGRRSGEAWQEWARRRGWPS